MRKGKVPRMQLLSNERSRRKQFEKRKTSLEKAAKDLSTLCGVDIGMVVFGPHSKQQDPEEQQQPTLWNQQVLTGLIEGYKARLCHDSRTKTSDPSDFFKEKTEKMKDEIEKLRFKLNFKSPEDARRFRGGLMAKIDAVRTRTNAMKRSRFSNNSYYYYNQPVQESAWKYEYETKPQPNFVYYSNNNNQMTGYDNVYGGASAYNMCGDQNNNYASNYGTYGMNTNYVPAPQQMMMSYDNEAAPGGCCNNYLPPPKTEQQMLALEWGSGQQPSIAAQWFLNDQSLTNRHAF